MYEYSVKSYKRRRHRKIHFRNGLSTLLALFIIVTNVVSVPASPRLQAKETGTVTGSIESQAEAFAPESQQNGPANDRNVVPIQWTDRQFSTSVTPTPGAGTDMNWDKWRRILTNMIDIHYPAWIAADANYDDVVSESYNFDFTACTVPTATIAEGFYPSEAFANAIAYKLGAYNNSFGYGTHTPAQILNVARNQIITAARNHIVNAPGPTPSPTATPDPEFWGTSYHEVADPCTYRNWLSASFFPASRLGLAAWLIWDELGAVDSGVQAQIRNIIEYEADRFIRGPYYYMEFPQGIDYWPNVGYNRYRNGQWIQDENESWPATVESGNTKAEETAAMARILMLATAMLPNHPHWDAWMTKGLELSIASNGTPTDASGPPSGEYYHGKQLYYWLNGSNIEDNGTMVNHYRVQPDYFAEIVNVMVGAMTFSLAGRSAPKGVFYNVDKVYNALTTPVPAGTPRPPLVTPTATVPICANSPNGPGLSYSGTIYTTTSNYVCYPQGTSYSGPPRIDSYAVMDAMASVFGLTPSPTSLPTSTPSWEDRHTQGALAVATAVPTVWYYEPEFPQNSPTPTAVPYSTRSVGQPALDKAGEAYLLKWLQKQPYFSAAAPLKTNTSNLPLGWRDQDIGAVTKMGWSTTNASPYSIPTFTIKGGGSDSTESGTQERLHFTYQEWQGDVEVVARKTSSPSGSTSAQIGIMIRNELTPGARHARLVFQQGAPGGSLSMKTPYFKWRSHLSSTAQQAGPVDTTNEYNWVKLVRRGNRISAWTSNNSTNGSDGTWKLVGVEQTINMGSKVYVGLTAASYDPNSYVTGQFDNVKITRPGSSLIDCPTNCVSASWTISTTEASPNDTVDGIHSMTSYWADRGKNSWIQYNLGATKKIDTVWISWFGDFPGASQPGNRIQSFEIQVATSQTPLTYTTVYSGTSTGHNLVAIGSEKRYLQEPFHFMPVAAQYVRIVGRGNSAAGPGTASANTTAWEMIIGEVSIYGSAITEVFAPSPNPSPTPVYSSPCTNPTGQNLQKLRDGDLRDTSNWQCETPEAYTYTLEVRNPSGALERVDYVGIAWLRGNSREGPNGDGALTEWRSNLFEIHTSTDNGATWTWQHPVTNPLAGAWSTGRTKGLELYSLPPNTLATNIIVKGFGNGIGPNYNFNITELRFYRDSASCQPVNLPVSWDHSNNNARFVNVTEYGSPANSILKNSNSGNTWNGGASSTHKILSGEGFIETTAVSRDHHTIFGLSNGDSNQNYTDIDFAVHLQGLDNGSWGAHLQIFELGDPSPKKDFDPDNYVAGDKFRVGVEGGKIVYRRNSNLIYISPATTIPYPLLLDASVFHQPQVGPPAQVGAKVSNAYIAGCSVGTGGTGDIGEPGSKGDDNSNGSSRTDTGP